MRLRCHTPGPRVRFVSVIDRALGHLAQSRLGYRWITHPNVNLRLPLDL